MLTALLYGLAASSALVIGAAVGAVLASLADTLLPEAFESAGPVTALATAAGFFLAFVLAA